MSRSALHHVWCIGRPVQTQTSLPQGEYKCHALPYTRCGALDVQFRPRLHCPKLGTSVTLCLTPDVVHWMFSSDPDFTAQRSVQVSRSGSHQMWCIGRPVQTQTTLPQGRYKCHALPYTRCGALDVQFRPRLHCPKVSKSVTLCLTQDVVHWTSSSDPDFTAPR